MTSLEIETHKGDTMSAQAVPQPSNIKIRFKKGAFFSKLADASAGFDTTVSQLPIRLSPKSEKRKAAEEIGISDEQVVKRVKAGDMTEAMESIAIDSSYQAKEFTTPNSSITDATISSTPTKKVPLQPASIYRKLAKKLSTQPVLLENLREYRISLTNQHRDDAKLVATLQAQISNMAKEAAEKELRATEELKASQDMVLFWTDSCNEEYEETMLLKQKLRDLIGRIQGVGEAGARGNANANAGAGKGAKMGLEPQKLVAELANLIEEKRERRVRS